jgi:hypothetical protein
MDFQCLLEHKVKMFFKLFRGGEVVGPGRGQAGWRARHVPGAQKACGWRAKVPFHAEIVGKVGLNIGNHRLHSGLWVSASVSQWHNIFSRMALSVSVQACGWQR